MAPPRLENPYEEQHTVVLSRIIGNVVRREIDSLSVNKRRRKEARDRRSRRHPPTHHSKPS